MTNPSLGHCPAHLQQVHTGGFCACTLTSPGSEPCLADTPICHSSPAHTRSLVLPPTLRVSLPKATGTFHSTAWRGDKSVSDKHLQGQQTSTKALAHPCSAHDQATVPRCALTASWPSSVLGSYRGKQELAPDTHPGQGLPRVLPGNDMSPWVPVMVWSLPSCVTSDTLLHLP